MARRVPSRPITKPNTAASEATMRHPAFHACSMTNPAQKTADYWRLLVVEGLAERRRRPVAEMAEKAMRENGEQA
jgi:hypothetical protein